MSDTKKIFIEEYNYTLPDERIAKFPLEKRDESKLLIYRDGLIEQTRFKSIDRFLPSNAFLVFNNTKVIHARLLFQKETGATIEVFCLEPHEPSDYLLSFQETHSCVWKCLVGNAKRWKGRTISKEVIIGEQPVRLTAEKTNEKENLIRFSWDNPAFSFAEILDVAGRLPIPPYLHRDSCERDEVTYQTVYSKIEGSVAAPTAGLHFTEAVFKSLRNSHIGHAELTLHVGAGTFQPVKSDTVQEHNMHTEFFSISRDTIRDILNHLDGIIAVGTTSVRTLESLYYIGLLLEGKKLLSDGRLKVCQWMPYETTGEPSIEKALSNILEYMDRNGQKRLDAETQIIIVPGYKFKVVKGIVTNFHQPQSTLLLLIAALVGEDWKKIYRYALENDFRFLSYGDSSLLFPNMK